MDSITTTHVSAPLAALSNAHLYWLCALALPKDCENLTDPNPNRIKQVRIFGTPQDVFFGKSLHQGRLFHIPKIGNLSSMTVSKAGRTRATSHHCERGAGLPQKQAGSGVAKFSTHALAPIFVEVCDVARSKIRPTARPRFLARLFGGRRSGATRSRTDSTPQGINYVGAFAS